MKYFNKIGAFVGAALLGLAGVVGAATYWGWNPSTGLETTHGILVDGGFGTLPALSGSCGTRSGQVGGAATGVFVAGAVTTCTTTITFQSAAPNGFACSFTDLTTPADTIRQTSYTTTSATTSAATIVSGDTISYDCVGF